MPRLRPWMGFLLIAAVLFPAAPADAQRRVRNTRPAARVTKKKPTSSPKKESKPQKDESEPGPKDFTSKNFLIHTDLPADKAKELLKRLENMVSLISKYWGRPNKKTIECYVVDNLASWPVGSFDPRGLRAVENRSGVTISQVRSNGVDFDANAIVYAVSQRDTAMHEVVHAYCAQTFGTVGPVWYSEGMAEMGHFWKENDRSVNCDPYFIKYLHDSEPKSMLEIVNPDQVSGDSWQNYAWRWALCHLLANNTNYADRFYPLGLGLLTGQKVSFEEVYGSMAQEISFEYLFFLKHFDRGYRVDLCSWDWKTRSRKATPSTPVVSRINAGRGWQASRLHVTKGAEYEFSTDGTWKTAKDGEETSADGSRDGRGKLVAALFDDYELTEAFDLGAGGSFVAPRDGDLVLRCRDAWTEIADNSGHIKVTFKLKRANEQLATPDSFGSPPEAQAPNNQAE